MQAVTEKCVYSNRPRKLSAMDVCMGVTAILSLLLLLFAAAQTQAQTMTVLHNFDLRADGGLPYAGVTLDQQGRIYGTTSDGGTRNGVVFRMVHSGSGWVLTPIYTFHGPDGSVPYSRVVFGPDGALYGTTSSGGAGNFGTVFRLRPPATTCHAALCPWTEAVLYNFTGGSDGGSPYFGDLVFDQAGNIYGTTLQGGASGKGVVFKLSHSGSGWTETVLWSFTGGGEGGYPYSGVFFDGAGNLYGTTSDGGAGGYGTAYELSPTQSGWTENTLYSFTGNNDGTGTGGMVMDASGHLFGMTGGIYPGAAYELVSQSGNWAFNLLQSFTGTYPGPLTSPTFDSHGNLYGPVPTGGTGNGGEIFKLTPSGGGWSYSVYFDFLNGPGYDPVGVVAFDASGNMYGTTAEGGTHSWGTVWQITP